jgi:endonuclease III
MKHGTAYAKRLKRFYGRIKRVDCPPEMIEPADPLEQLVLAILGLDSSRAQASRALDKLLAGMVDFNEIRVSPARQVAQLIAPHVPDSLGCASRLCSVLNAVFNSLNTLRLDILKNLGKREARARLEKLDGIDPYTVASVLLWGLGGHAVPVNNRMLDALRRDDIVEPNSPTAEVQAFLERHISPAEAKTFCLSLDHYSAQSGSAKAKSPADARSGRRPANSPAPRRARTAAAPRKAAPKR